MNEQDIFEAVEAAASTEPGGTVHSNTHNHALVENPFAWDDEDNASEE